MRRRGWAVGCWQRWSPSPPPSPSSSSAGGTSTGCAAARRVQAFLTGAGPAAIGAIAGSAIPLGLALSQLWQVGVLAAALIWMLALRRNVVVGLIAAALIGVAVSLLGVPVRG